ncbi:hypothetical protein HDU96_008035 [Phlyctochytrium bullatum]|nr:hypothetical protein HDU96_008035 [Phlyctochytrium bullatum]
MAPGPRKVIPVDDEPAATQDLKDGHDPIEWKNADALQVYTIGGEPVRLTDLWKDGRTVLMFLRRWECQTCLSYIILFAHLQPILSRGNIRLVFITCHNDLSEANLFLVTFAFWLQKLKDQNSKAVRDNPSAKNERLAWSGALPGELYVDMDRSVYEFFGLTPTHRQMRDSFWFFTLFYYWNIFGLYGKKLNIQKKNKLHTYIYSRRVLYRNLLAWIKIPEKKHVWRQTPGLVVVENNKCLYRFISMDQYNPVPSNSNNDLANALVCAAPEVELLDAKVTEGLKTFSELMDDPGKGGMQKAENLKLISRLGKGKESEVFSSTWMGLKVAVKFFRIEGTTTRDEHGTQQIDQGIKSFANEAAILMSLRHKNVIMFLGFGSRPPHQFLIMELMPRGSLFSVLGDKSIPIDGARKKSFLLDAAAGIAFLHGCRPQVVHQDLKSLNLLIADDWTLKVSDFGIAHARRSRQNKTGATSAGTAEEDDDDGIAGGTPQWMSPEHMMFEGSPTTKMDVFSFAVIMWEVAARDCPWRNITANQVEDNVKAGKRLPLPETWNAKFRKFVQTCWSQNPRARPEFPAIIKTLTKLDVPP